MYDRVLSWNMEKDFNKLMIQRDWFIIQYGTLNAQYYHNLMPHTWAMIFGKDLLQPKRTSGFFLGLSW